MELIKRFDSFLGSDLALYIPQEMREEIGAMFFEDFKLPEEFTEIDLDTYGPYFRSLKLNKNITKLNPKRLYNLLTLNLGILHLSLNNQISELPYLPKLQKLDLGTNNQISELPYFQNLKKLYLGFNKQISELPDLPNLQELYLGLNNKQIRELPDLLELQILYLESNDQISEKIIKELKQRGVLVT